MLFTERIQGNELLGQMFSTTEAFGNKHDLAYQLCVGHHHGTRSDPGDKTMNVRLSSGLNEAQSEEHCCVPPEESLQVLGKLRPACIAWVHGDEDPYRGLQGDALIQEQEAGRRERDLFHFQLHVSSFHPSVFHTRLFLRSGFGGSCWSLC